jgi:nucleoside-diphosphate-sugar epimerase
MQSKGVCLVTGGAGFIGSYLCESILDAGYRVIAVDNLATGRKENLEVVSRNPDFSFIRHDVVEPYAGKYSDKITHIFHLASPASVVDYQRLAEETALVNSVGTGNLLRIARDTGAKFLFASTSEVYGDPKIHPQRESYWGNVNPVGIRACYDESKRFGEMMTLLYFSKYRLDARIIRIFNTYGPRMRVDDGRVISNLVNQAIGGNRMTVYGHGKQTRSFCYISDLVDGILRAMFTEGTSGQVVNLGNPEQYSIVDLAEKIKDMTGSRAEIVFQDLPADDPEVRQPDISKAKMLLGWEPRVTVTEGLSKTIEYYRSL